MLIQATGKTIFSHIDPFCHVKVRRAESVVWLIIITPQDISKAANLVTEVQHHPQLRAQICTGTEKVSSRDHFFLSLGLLFT